MTLNVSAASHSSGPVVASSCICKGYLEIFDSMLPARRSGMGLNNEQEIFRLFARVSVAAPVLLHGLYADASSKARKVCTCVSAIAP